MTGDLIGDSLIWTSLLFLLTLAAAIWLGASLLHIGRRVLRAQKRVVRLARRMLTADRDVALAAETAAAQERRAEKLEKTLAERVAALNKIEDAVQKLRADSAREYRLLAERLGSHDLVFLFAVARGGPPQKGAGAPPQTERWAVPAPTQDAAAKALAAAVGDDAALELIGKLERSA